MNADKEVGLGLVGYISTGMQRYKHISLTGVNDLHILAVLLHHSSEGQRHIQVDMFLFRNGTNGPSIMTAMSGVNHQRKGLIFRCM